MASISIRIFYGNYGLSWQILAKLKIWIDSVNFSSSKISTSKIYYIMELVICWKTEVLGRKVVCTPQNLVFIAETYHYCGQLYHGYLLVETTKLVATHRIIHLKSELKTCDSSLTSLDFSFVANTVEYYVFISSSL